MKIDYWLEKWASNQISFHQVQENPFLLKYWTRLLPQQDEKVLVPLCGKSEDLVWLASRHQEVYGVEVSEIAVRALFAENFYTPLVTRVDSSHELYQFDELNLYRGDFFTAPLPAVDLIYDRAAMVVISPEERQQYAERLLALLKTGGRILLISAHYEHSDEFEGIFPVQQSDLERLFPHCRIACLSESVLLGSEETEFESGGFPDGDVWLIEKN
ncbi:Thiopurine S-methyltransferase [Vibrio aerogenes CECT 7868]|uniref:thiopurine S-methyltransferase n=1 Tax=Vibrio aerogenes CECT 7868 TaxID=1216006 RepID=A0A1M5XV56_9VIBR|nr:Thiopurine S-methyltransferase [Vibrio aerogenes CECT 7868]